MTPEEKNIILPALKVALGVLEAAAPLILNREIIRDAVKFLESQEG